MRTLAAPYPLHMQKALLVVGMEPHMAPVPGPELELAPPPVAVARPSALLLQRSLPGLT